MTESGDVGSAAMGLAPELARVRSRILKLAQDGNLLVPMAGTFKFDDAPAAFAAPGHDRRQPRSHLTGPEQAMTVWDRAARPARLPDRPYPSSLLEKQHSWKLLSQGDTLERHGR
jgi:hypothetical protein